MRPILRTTTFPRALLASAALAATISLAACSSSDDDSSGDDDVDNADETSMLAPGGENEQPDLTPVVYTIPLTVEEEVPAPTGVPEGAGGEAVLTYDPATRGMTGTVTTTGLTGAPTMAHIHDQVAGEATGPVAVGFVPAGDGTGFMLPGDTILTEEQAESLETGLLYVNVHTDANPAGEIRGQIVLDESDED